MTFKAIFCSDGAPVDIEQEVVLQGGASRPQVRLLGRYSQAALLVSPDDNFAEDSVGPVSINGCDWLVGRIRLDRRADLLAALSLPAKLGSADFTDQMLCLKAYERWGEGFLDHLYGDFCFVIWSDAEQAMICARDQLGGRSLFAAQIGNRWLVSDAFEQVRVSSGLDDRLDPVWIADFLAFGLVVDPDRSVYAALKRVPAAHYLRLSGGLAALRKYWTLELQEPLQYSNPQRYVEEFHARLSEAVAERLPPGRVGISLSGGLDSSTLAAKAVEIAGSPSRVVAQTRVFRSLIPDDEDYFSKAVAAKLGIRHSLIAQDSLDYDPDWPNNGEVTAEPNMVIVGQAAEKRIAEDMRDEAKVWFFGEGPDNALTFEWRPYLRWFLTEGKWMRLLAVTIDFIRITSFREWSKAVRRISRGKRPWISPLQSALPDCINADFAKENEIELRSEARNNHPWRPAAFASFTSSIWQQYFEEFEPTLTNTPIEWRHPYLDLRVLEFLLAVPPIPWAKRKHLMRRAMRGILPDEVLRRDKTPLREDPFAVLLRRHPLPKLPQSSPVARFVDLSKVSAAEAGSFDVTLRISVLDHWMRQRGYA